MTIYEVTLRPLAPYFFGGERTQPYGEDNTKLQETNPYFTHSEAMLRQTAAFGVLRFLGIRNPNAQFSIEKDKERIGSRSFNPHKEQTYGLIQAISPVFLKTRELSDGVHEYLIPAPAHVIKKKDNSEKEEGNGEKKSDGTAHYHYACFSDFTEITEARLVKGEHEKVTKILPRDYSSKNPLDTPFLSCPTSENGIGKIYENNDETIIVTQTRIGINRNITDGEEDDNGNKGFFKKEYCFLPNHDFCFFATLNDSDSNPYFNSKEGSTVVTVGQRKTPFLASWKPVEKDKIPRVPSKIVMFPNNDVVKEGKYSIKEIVRNDDCTKCFDLFQTPSVSPPAQQDLSKGMWAYVLSDTFLKNEDSLEKIVNISSFSCVYNTHTYRRFETIYSANSNQKKRYERCSTVHRMLAAGSVFYFADSKKTQFEAEINMPHARIGGFNTVYYSKSQEPFSLFPSDNERIDDK